MGINGVYRVKVVIFDVSVNMELHIKENKLDAIASLKDGVMNRSFYNGRTNMSPEEKESHNFIFENAQIDDYVNIKPPAGYKGGPVTLRPPGGFHIGGVTLAGTVLNDELTGVIIFKNGLVSSVHGTRVPGKPVVNTSFRTDGMPGINRYCTCGTGSCTHHGFCDSCQIFDSLRASELPAGMLPVEQCMMSQYEKVFGPVKRPSLPVGKDGKPGVEHGPHHLVEE